MIDFMDIHPDVAGRAGLPQSPSWRSKAPSSTHGMPWPDNDRMAGAVEDIIRAEDAIPATIAVIDGRPQGRALARRAPRPGPGQKRDEAVAGRPGLFGLRGPHRRHDGGRHDDRRAAGRHKSSLPRAALAACTRARKRVSTSPPISTSWPAHRSSGCPPAGAKAILDIEKTLEVLETRGVPVVGYATDTMPAFWSRSSPFPRPAQARHGNAIARFFRTRSGMGIWGGRLVANPGAARGRDRGRRDGRLHCTRRRPTRKGTWRDAARPSRPWPAVTDRGTDRRRAAAPQQRAWVERNKARRAHGARGRGRGATPQPARGGSAEPPTGARRGPRPGRRTPQGGEATGGDHPTPAGRTSAGPTRPGKVGGQAGPGDRDERSFDCGGLGPRPSGGALEATGSGGRNSRRGETALGRLLGARNTRATTAHGPPTDPEGEHGLPGRIGGAFNIDPTVWCNGRHAGNRGHTGRQSARKARSWVEGRPEGRPGIAVAAGRVTETPVSRRGLAQRCCLLTHSNCRPPRRPARRPAADEHPAGAGHGGRP